jgi:hypothetical protein
MGAPSSPGFQLGQTFFGFKPEDRVTHHESLFNLLWYGAGRWDWETLYNMPVYLRRFWIKKINKMTEEAQARAEQQRSKQQAKRGQKIVKSPL